MIWLALRAVYNFSSIKNNPVDICISYEFWFFSAKSFVKLHKFSASCLMNYASLSGSSSSAINFQPWQLKLFIMTDVTSDFQFPGKERIVKEEKIDFSKKDDEKWKRRSLPAGKVQGRFINLD